MPASFAAPFDPRSLIPDEVQRNLRLEFDLAARGRYETDSNEFSHAQFIGFDLHKVFTKNRGDAGTLIFQGYLTRVNNMTRRPFFFDDEDDWEFVYRIANVNLPLASRNAMNLRVGHFEIPYGLEHTIDTNGTLRDYTHGINLGVKADWGATLNGSLSGLEYEFGWSRGSGNNWESRGDPHIFAGRLGTHRSRNLVMGVAAMKGDVYNPAVPGFTVERERLGVDLQWFLGSFTVMGEASLGKDEGQNVRNALFEVDFNSRDGSTLLYFQLLRLATERPGLSWKRVITTRLGASVEFSRRWTADVQFSYDHAAPLDVTQTNALAAQLRYRF